MHWNTNVDMMTNIMPEEIYDMLESAFYTDDTHERRNINTFSPFGDQLISFDHDDFFNEDGSRKNTTVLAWMLKTNKLTTDVGTNKNDMVKDPYVFANGVNAPVKPVIKQKEKEETKKKYLLRGLHPRNSGSLSPAKNSPVQKFLKGGGDEGLCP